MMGDAPSRRRAAALAGLRGDAPTAAALLDDDDPRVRAAALGALDRCDALDGAALERGLRDGDAGVRRRAAALAARHAEVALAGALDDPDPFVVEMAAWAAGERPDDPQRAAVVTRLVSLARAHPDVLVREAAVAALGSLEAPEGRAVVLDAMADRPTIRRRAVLALAAYEGPEVMAALHHAAEDRDWQVRDAAEELLRILEGPEADSAGEPPDDGGASDAAAPGEISG